MKVLRVGLVCALAMGALAGTAGCTYLAPSATLESYNPADGVTLSSGDVDLNNALWVSDNGEAAQLSGVLSNNGTTAEEVNLTLWVSGGTQQKVTLDLKSGESVALGSTKDATVIVPNLGVKPGGNAQIYLQSGSSEGQKTVIPVMDKTFSEYASLVPTPSTGTN